MTLADDLKAIITTYYGALGGGGTPPSIIENVVDLPADYQPSKEHILVWIPRPAVREPITTDFAKVTHTVMVRMITSVSDDRLEIIVNEVRRVLGTNAVSGMDSQEVSEEIDLSNRFSQIFIMEFEVTLIDDLAANTTAYGGESCVDDDAIHDNVASEISVITEKGTPIGADMVLIEDSADSNNKKMIQLSNLPGGAGPGSGTQWTLPVWDTTSTLGDSMISQDAGGTAAVIGGSVTVSTIAAEATDVDKFLVSNAGLVKFRTGAELYSDIDGYLTSDFTTDFAAESLANLTTRAHTDLSDAPTDAHHVRYADSEVESVITAELVDGQSIDIAIDALILTHKNITDAHHTETHVLAVTGPHTGTLPLTDLAVGTQGGIIRRGAADWEEYALGTPTYVLKAGASDVAWGQVDYSELSGSQPAPIAHSIDDETYHTASGLTAGWVISADTATTFSWKAPTGGADPDAIHDNVSDEINQIAVKGSPIGADILVIEDSESTWAKKKVTITSLGTGGPGSGTQWTLPVWDTTSTLGDSVISQNAGGTELYLNSQSVIGNTSLNTNGLSRLEIYGINSSATAPALKLVGDDDVYPVYQVIGWTHDSINIGFDAYFDASDWRSSDVGSNFLVQKFGNSYKILYAAAITAGNVITWNDGIEISSTGVVTIAGTTTLETIDAGVADYDKFLVSDGGIIKFRTGSELASDIGAASVPLALTDLASYVQGSIIKGGAADWDTLTLGTETNVLKAGASEPAWGTVDWSELTGTQPAPIAHVLAVTGPHTGSLPLADIADYTQGRIIKGGAADWDYLAPGSQYQILKMAASEPAWANEVFTKGGNILSPAVGYRTIWIAPFACTITQLIARQKGGTNTVVNARINGTSQVLTSDLTLVAADTTYSNSAFNDSSIASGEFLEIEVVTVASATEILIQLDLTRP